MSVYYMHFACLTIMIKPFLFRNVHPEDRDHPWVHYHPRNFVEGDRVITLDEFFREKKDKHYFLVGESLHDDSLMVDTQFEMLKAAFKQNPRIVVGIETLASHSQAGLVNSYLQGNASLDQLAQASYFPMSVHPHKKILEYAKENGIGVVPLSGTAEEAFGISFSELGEFCRVNYNKPSVRIPFVLKGYKANDDIMSTVLGEIPQQVLVLLGDWHTSKEFENLTKKLPKGTFITGDIDGTTFKDPKLDNRVILYQPTNPNYHSRDYKVVRT